MCHPDEHTSLRAGQRPRIDPSVFDCLPRCFKQYAVLRVDRDRLALVDAEEVRVESTDILQEGPPLRGRLTRHA
ncbi:Uncharacterised protein [Mycobacteroides abscessus subsp. abscessus]|nr:Uncharacterised protein [Mycobacteroides abscessus subsp. abscessus]